MSSVVSRLTAATTATWGDTDVRFRFFVSTVYTAQRSGASSNRFCQGHFSSQAPRTPPHDRTTMHPQRAIWCPPRDAHANQSTECFAETSSSMGKRWQRHTTMTTTTAKRSQVPQTISLAVEGKLKGMGPTWGLGSLFTVCCQKVSAVLGSRCELASSSSSMACC